MHNISLPFVPLPPQDISLAWDALSTNLQTRYPVGLSSPFIDYFDRIWMNGNYPVQQWNCYDRTLSNFPRTNNRSEGSNSAIKTHFGCSNPSIWLCITKLKELQAATELDLTQFYTYSWRATKPRRVAREREARILSMVRDYNRTDVLNYC